MHLNAFFQFQYNFIGLGWFKNKFSYFQFRLILPKLFCNANINSFVFTKYLNVQYQFSRLKRKVNSLLPNNSSASPSTFAWLNRVNKIDIFGPTNLFFTTWLKEQCAENIYFMNWIELNWIRSTEPLCAFDRNS